MAAEHILIPYPWRKQLAYIRALLGASCLIIALLTQQTAKWPLVALLVCFTAYSLVAAVWQRLEQAGYTSVTLLLDVGLFLVSASQPVSPGVWLTFVIYFYLLLVVFLIHEWRKVWPVVGMCLTYLLLMHPPQTPILWPTILLAGVFACVLSLYKKMLQDRLSASYRRAVLFRSEAEIARDAERQRIGADFHDGPLQSFISFQMRLEIVRKLMERDSKKAMEELKSLQEICKSQVTELRSFVRSMRPIQVDGDSLDTSMRQIAQHFQKDSGIPVTFVNGDFVGPSQPEVSMEILQLVREALHNVQKHAKASRVSVEVVNSEKYLEIYIEDDGAGFPFSGSYNLDELELLRLGPVSIQRRVRSLGGEMTLESNPGRGAGLKILIPS